MAWNLHESLRFMGGIVLAGFLRVHRIFGVNENDSHLVYYPTEPHATKEPPRISRVIKGLQKTCTSFQSVPIISTWIGTCLPLTLFNNLAYIPRR